MTYTECLEMAARAWCDEKTEHIEMNGPLAEVFADTLFKVYTQAHAAGFREGVEAAAKWLDDGWPEHQILADALRLNAKEGALSAQPAEPAPCPECGHDAGHHSWSVAGWLCVEAGCPCKRKHTDGHQGCKHERTSTFTAGDPFEECRDCGAYKMVRDGIWRLLNTDNVEGPCPACGSRYPDG